MSHVAVRTVEAHKRWYPERPLPTGFVRITRKQPRAPTLLFWLSYAPNAVTTGIRHRCPIGWVDLLAICSTERDPLSDWNG